MNVDYTEGCVCEGVFAADANGIGKKFFKLRFPSVSFLFLCVVK